jgi:hypothetical protein
MFIDVLSPLKLTSLAMSSVSNMVSFIGLVLIFGTILGIILDGIHHNVIEDWFFDNIEGYKDTKYVKYQWMRKCGGLLDFENSCKSQGLCSRDCKWLKKDSCPIEQNRLTRHYSFKTIESKVIELNTFFVDDYYSYSEFYSNTFLSLIPFSLVVPSFLLESFEIPWIWSVRLGYISFFFGWLCLYCSYSSYKAYANVVNSVMFAYVKENNKCQNAESGLTIDVDGKLTFKGKLPIDVNEKVTGKVKVSSQ